MAKLLEDENKVKKIVRAMLLNTGLLEDKDDVVRTFFNSLEEAERKIKVDYAFQLLPKYLQRLMDKEYFHLVYFLLEFIEKEVTTKEAITLYDAQDQPLPGMSQRIADLKNEFLESFKSFINENKNLPEFLLIDETEIPTDFLTQFYEVGGQPGTDDFLENPLGYFNFKNYNFPNQFGNWLNRQQQRLKFITTTELTPIIAHLRRTDLTHISLQGMNFFGAAVFQGKSFTVKEYKYLLKNFIDKEIKQQQIRYKEDVEKVKKGQFTLNYALENQDIINIYEVYDLLKRLRDIDELMPRYEVLYHGQPVVNIDGAKIRIDDALIAYQWLKNPKTIIPKPLPTPLPDPVLEVKEIKEPPQLDAPPTGQAPPNIPLPPPVPTNPVVVNLTAPQPYAPLPTIPQPPQRPLLQAGIDLKTLIPIGLITALLLFRRK